jgi:hypothetical protein
MICGETAKRLYGLPGEAENIEFIVALCKLILPDFLPLFRESFDMDETHIANQVLIREGFDIADRATGLKIRFNLLELGEAYRQAEFSRRKKWEIDGFETWIISVEDLLLSLLLSSVPPQLTTETRALLEKHRVDKHYLKKWAAQIGVDTRILDL